VAGRPVVLFDGPATAVRAVLPLLADHTEVSVAVHVAEVDREAAVAGGAAVDTLLALAAETPPGSIHLTPITRDLLAASGLPLTKEGGVDAVVTAAAADAVPSR
jgi:hypothetical protein